MAIIEMVLELVRDARVAIKAEQVEDADWLLDAVEIDLAIMLTDGDGKFRPPICTWCRRLKPHQAVP